jgi:hypothetical protein
MDIPTPPGEPIPAGLEARIRELELRLRKLKIPNGSLASADEDTNGCTYGCTHGCTNGCTGAGCVNPAITVPGRQYEAGGRPSTEPT